jgi:hypothetical protein
MAREPLSCPNCGAAIPPSQDLTCPACGAPLPSQYRGPSGIGFFIAIYAFLMVLTALFLGLYAWLG